MDSITDPENRTTLYDWCSCGSLHTITDANNHVTTFNRDIQGRVYEKVFANNTALTYLYEGQSSLQGAGTSSRVKSMSDALNRRTNYSYTTDNNVSAISYTDLSGAALSPPTPSVSYTDEPYYNRLSTMNDGTGLTTSQYKPITVPPTLGAGRLQTTDGPLLNDTITYTYDQLGRPLGRSINGVASTADYDALGRVTTTDNPLGHFSRGYEGLTARLHTLTYPNGQTATSDYFGGTSDRRLQTLQNLAPGAVNLSKFDYTYDAEGEVKSWSKLLGATSSGRWFEYDNAQQLRSARNAFDPNLASEQQDYLYDLAGNRTSDADYIPNARTATGTFHVYTPNTVNQLGDIRTTINSNQGALLPLSYDLAGNMTDDAAGKTFEWDAANRLVAINYPALNKRSEFNYDGLSRRVKLVEKTGTTVNSTKQFVWVGNALAQERDGSNVITRSYFSEGEQRGAPSQRGGAPNYYYARDHLGSIREMTDSSGVLQARYDYDSYGNRTKLSGTLDVDFGYTGHYFHTPSGLNLSLFRAYSPALGRWLSRDPIGEDGGLNLYAYVVNIRLTSLIHWVWIHCSLMVRPSPILITAEML